MKALIITNNPKMNEEFNSNPADLYRSMDIDFREGADQMEILKAARDLIHLGAKLVIHPMMGRVKPHETPYKSVLMEVLEDDDRARGVTCDFMSITIIEDSIAETDKFLNNTFRRKYDDSMLPDLQEIDRLLIRTGMEEYRMHR
ncbi:MAG: GrdX family protein [Firmicutes bacterium]|nr:GrdX family protein [Bacillota bacterium]